MSADETREEIVFELRAFKNANINWVTDVEKAKVVAESADEFVHRNPWEAVGVAAGLGLLIGLFIRRR